MRAKNSKRVAEPGMGELVEMVRREMEREFPVLRQEQRHVFGLALKEAEALAWNTPVPLLVFPLLAYEKLKLLDRWNRRQKRVKEMQGEQIALAA